MYHERSRSADRGTRSIKFDHIRRAGLGFGAYIIGIVAATTLVGALSAPTAQAQAAEPFQVSSNPIATSGNSTCSIVNAADIYEAAFIDETYTWNGGSGNVERSNARQSFNEAMSKLDEGSSWYVTERNWGDGTQSLELGWYSPGPSEVAPTLAYDGYGQYFMFNGSPYIQGNARTYSTVTITISEVGGECYYTATYKYPSRHAVSSQPFNTSLVYFTGEYLVDPAIADDLPVIPDKPEVPDPTYQDPWNLPASETADCDWWNLTCFMGTVDFNPIRDVTQQASQNLGFIAQFGQVIGELTEMMTAMPYFIGGSVDPCWTTGQSSYCNIPVNIFDQESSISLHYIRNSPVMQAIMPWLLYAMMGLMSWNLFKSLPELIEDITKA